MTTAQRFRSAGVIASLLIVGFAEAGDDYRCVIERITLAGGDSGSVLEYYRRIYVGKEFTVERRSGLMAGALKNSYVTKPQVIDYGSKANSYKVVTTLRQEQGAGAGSNIYVLNVLEYVEPAKKPFVFLRNAEVFFGHCVHF